tara:strand:- start:29122 stop:34527 length:5406 start_codon:yes stop_codon:yes gene_type:complete
MAGRKQEIVNTATGQSQSYDDVGEAPELNVPDLGDANITPPAEQFDWSEVDSTDYSKLNMEYMGNTRPEDSQLNNNIMSEQQSGWSKFGNSFSAGLTKGVVSAATPFLEEAAHYVGIFDEQMGNSISGLDDQIKAGLTDYFDYYENDMGSNPTFLEEWWRWQSLESTTSSVSQFALLAATAGGLTKGLGSLALKAGSRIAATEGSAAMLAKQFTMGAGRALTQAVRGPLGIASDAMAQSVVSNMFEGYVMADEVKKQMENTYAPALYDPAVDQETKNSILDEIDEAGNGIMAYNTLFIANNIIGFSALGSALNNKLKGATKLKGLGAVSLSEGLEENLQNVISAGQEFKAMGDIDKEYANKNQMEINLGTTTDSPVLKPEDGLLWKIDPERAGELAVENAYGVGEAMIEHATSRQAALESMAGLLGGGPQFIMTGLPSKLKNYKKTKEQQASSEATFKSTSNKLAATEKENIRSNTELLNTLETLKEYIPEDADDAYLRDVTSDYILTEQVLTAIENKTEDQFKEFLGDQQTQNEASYKDGTLTQEEYNKFQDRVGKATQMLEEYKNIGTYVNSAEIIAATRKQRAYEAAIEAYDKAEARKPKKKAPKAKAEKEVPTTPPQSKAQAAYAVRKQTDAATVKLKEILDSEGEDGLSSTQVEEVERLRSEIATGKESMAKMAPLYNMDKVTVEVEQGTLSSDNPEDVKVLVKMKSNELKGINIMIDKMTKGGTRPGNPKVTAMRDKLQEEVDFLTTKEGNADIEGAIEGVEPPDTSGATEVTQLDEETAEAEPIVEENVGTDKSLSEEGYTQMKVDLGKNERAVAYMKSANAQARAVRANTRNKALSKKYSHLFRSTDIGLISNNIVKLQEDIALEKNKQTKNSYAEMILALAKRKHDLETVRDNTANKHEEDKEPPTPPPTAEELRDGFDKPVDVSGFDDGTSTEDLDLDPEVQTAPNEPAPKGSNPTPPGAPQTAQYRKQNDLVDKAIDMALKGTTEGDQEQAAAEVNRNGKTTQMLLMSGASKQVQDPDSDSQISLKQGRASLGLLTKFLDAYQTLNVDADGNEIDAYPPVEQAAMVLMALPGVSKENAINYVRAVYAGMQGAPVDNVAITGVAQEQTTVEEESVFEKAVESEDYTIASFPKSGTAIAWNLDENGRSYMEDYEVVKEGAETRYAYMTDEALEESYDELVVIGGYQGIEEEHLTWKEYKDRVKAAKEGDPVLRPEYAEHQVRPIQVIIGNNVVGFVHTPQWAEVRVVSGVSADSRDSVLADIEKLRSAVQRGTKTGNPVVGEVLGRDSNITISEGGTVTGTALREEVQDNKWVFKPSGTVFDNDSRVTYAVLTDVQQIQQNILSALIKKGIKPENIAISEDLKPGSLVAIVPIENTDKWQAVMVQTSKVEQGHMEAFSSLTNRIAKGKFTQSPNSYKNAIDSIISTAYDSAQGESTEMKLSVTATNGSETKEPTLIISAYLRSSKITLTIPVQRLPKGEGKVRYKYGTVAAEGKVNGANFSAADMKEFNKFVAGVMSSPESMPKMNIVGSKLYDFQFAGGKAEAVLLTDEQAEARGGNRKVNYRKFVGAYTQTNLQPTSVHGKNSYHVNTIVTTTNNKVVVPKSVKNRTKVATKVTAKVQKQIDGLESQKEDLAAFANAIELFMTLNKKMKAGKDKDAAFVDFFAEYLGLESLPMEMVRDVAFKSIGLTEKSSIITKKTLMKLKGQVAFAQTQIDELNNSTTKAKPILEMVYNAWGDSFIKPDETTEDTGKSTTFEDASGNSVNDTLIQAVGVLEELAYIERLDEDGKPCKD